MYSGSFFECQDNAMPNRWYTAYTGGAKDNVQAVSDYTSTPVYLSHHLQTHNYTRDLQSSDTPLLSLPCYTTVFGGRGFYHSTSCVWNSLPRTVLDSQSLSVVKTKLKTHLFHLVHNNGE